MSADLEKRLRIALDKLDKAEAEAKGLLARIEALEAERNRLTLKMAGASIFLRDFACLFRDFEDAAKAISANTGKSIDEARSILRRQEGEAARPGATCEAALKSAISAVSVR
jgi:hypothetical protein